MTRSALLATLARRLNLRVTSMDSETQSRLLEFLNETHREILSGPGRGRLRDGTITIASVADQPSLAVAHVARILRIWEAENDRELVPISLAQYRSRYPDPASYTGTPDCYVWAGYSPVALQPADASSLFVKSTAAGDTAQTAYIEGLVTGGLPRSVNVTLTGTTAVNVSSAISTWTHITKFYLSAVPAGVVTLHEDSGTGTELARLGIGQTDQAYQRLLLSPTPDAAITYSLDVQFEVSDLAQDTDEPRLPLDFHDLLVHGARMREYEKTDDTRYAQAVRDYTRRLGELDYYLHETASSEKRLSISADAGLSRLGPWFPAGS